MMAIYVILPLERLGYVKHWEQAGNIILYNINIFWAVIFGLMTCLPDDKTYVLMSNHCGLGSCWSLLPILVRHSLQRNKNYLTQNQRISWASSLSQGVYRSRWYLCRHKTRDCFLNTGQKEKNLRKLLISEQSLIGLAPFAMEFPQTLQKYLSNWFEFNDLRAPTALITSFKASECKS